MMIKRFNIQDDAETSSLKKYLDVGKINYKYDGSCFTFECDDEQLVESVLSMVALSFVHEVYKNAVYSIFNEELESYKKKALYGISSILGSSAEHHLFVTSRLILHFSKSDTMNFYSYMMFNLKQLKQEVISIIEMAEKERNSAYIIDEGEWFEEAFNGDFLETPMGIVIQPHYTSPFLNNYVISEDSNDPASGDACQTSKHFIDSYRESVFLYSDKEYSFERIDISEKDGIITIKIGEAPLAVIKDRDAENPDFTNTVMLSLFASSIVLNLPKKIVLHDCLSTKNRGWILKILNLNYYANKALEYCSDPDCPNCKH